MKKYTGMTNVQIGQIFNGLTFSAVAKVYHWMSKAVEEKQDAEEEGGQNYFCFVLIQGLTPCPYRSIKFRISIPRFAGSNIFGYELSFNINDISNSIRSNLETILGCLNFKEEQVWKSQSANGRCSLFRAVRCPKRRRVQTAAVD